MATMPSIGSNCTLVVADFTYGIKLFEIPNCADSSQSTTTSSFPVTSESSLESSSPTSYRNTAIAVSVTIIVVIAIIFVLVVVWRRKNKKNVETLKPNDIELDSPTIRDLKIVESIGRGNFGGTRKCTCI